jgi:peptidoglycan hydrolase-like protein with peptidoglycan-binding domain
MCFLMAACLVPVMAMMAGGNETAASVLAKRAQPHAPFFVRPVVDKEHGSVAGAQRALHSMGLYDGTTNGTLGPQTRQALSLYQRRLGLPVTGDVDKRTSLALANRELVEVCIKRSVPVAECLDAISEFQAAHKASEADAYGGPRR